MKTNNYVQVTGVGNFTNVCAFFLTRSALVDERTIQINIKNGDAGGELDPHGADGNGNPSTIESSPLLTRG